MKLMQYQRPGLAWPTFGRLTGLEEEWNRLLEAPLTVWEPALDMYEDKDGFSVRIELPGLNREDIQIALQEGVLVISGERKPEVVPEGTEAQCMERFYGKFSRSVTVPAAVAGDKVKAQYKDGILTITLPKAEEAKPKVIPVS